MIKRFPFLLTLIILFCFSCKKDNTVGTPTVSILAPVNLSTYVVFDTVVVKANVSDGVSLQSVTVFLENNVGVQVLPSVNIPVTGKSMSFTCRYPLNDIHLSNGEYTIVVRAFNGTNAALGFQQIYVDALPTIRLGIFAITRNSSGVHVMKIDTNFNVSTIYTTGGDYSSSDISSYYQQLYVTAADSGNENTLTMPSGSPAWSVTGITSSTPYFTNTYSYGNTVYLSRYNGLINSYSTLGTGGTLITEPAGYYAIKTCIWSNYLFEEQKNIGSLSRNLVLHYVASGGGYEQAALPGPVVAMCGMDVNDLFVFGNNNSGGAYMELFNIPGNIFYTPISLPSGNLLSVAQVSEFTYLLGFDNGTIYQYTYSPSGIIPFITGVVASHLQFDATDNLVIASAGKYVYTYDFASSSLLHTNNMQDSVLNLHVLYNK